MTAGLVSSQFYLYSLIKNALCVFSSLLLTWAGLDIGSTGSSERMKLTSPLSPSLAVALARVSRSTKTRRRSVVPS